jgi:SulP family sulfate permease
MLMPQSLAYALLAGLPPEAGLYASILPLVALCDVRHLGGAGRGAGGGGVADDRAGGRVRSRRPRAPLAMRVAAHRALAFLSGLMLVAMGLLRLGFHREFPVASGDFRVHHRFRPSSSRIGPAGRR